MELSNGLQGRMVQKYWTTYRLPSSSSISTSLSVELFLYSGPPGHSVPVPVPAWSLIASAVPHCKFHRPLLSFWFLQSEGINNVQNTGGQGNSMPAAQTEIIILMSRGFRLHSAQLIFLTELEANAVSPRKQTEPSPGTARLNTSQQRGQGRIGHV